MFKVGLFNDSFPPTIDGVANTVYNYANIINQNFGTPVVVTPNYPNVVDEYDFDQSRVSAREHFSRDAVGLLRCASDRSTEKQTE